MMGLRKRVEDRAVLLAVAFSLAVGMTPYQLLVGSAPPLQLKAFCTSWESSKSPKEASTPQVEMGVRAFPSWSYAKDEKGESVGDALTLSPWAALQCLPACLPAAKTCIPLPEGMLLAAQGVVLKCQEISGLWRQSSTNPWQVSMNKYILPCLLGGVTWGTCPTLSPHVTMLQVPTVVTGLMRLSYWLLSWLLSPLSY